MVVDLPVSSILEGKTSDQNYRVYIAGPFFFHKAYFAQNTEFKKGMTALVCSLNIKNFFSCLSTPRIHGDEGFM
jgi:hypothetical protein